MGNRSLTSRTAQWASGIGVLLALFAFAVGYATNTYSYDGAITDWWRPLLGSLPILAALLVGGLIASRPPATPYGWLWLLLGYGMA